MTIYLDTCALNRLTDHQTQARVLAETEAVLQVLELVAASDSEVRWSVSEFVRFEIARNPDALKRAQTIPLLDLASAEIETTPEMLRSAHTLEAQGFDPLDALHLAVCEESSIDFLLTVDYRLSRRAFRRSHAHVTQVLNPIDWLQRRSAWQRNLLPPT